ncbi:MAG: LysM peptidoglycan-binding domain-containing protein [Calothrix sp. FI2-JRJ7]|jgi:5'-nucleotidase|nr:LysM peptidoglycan-binding domain-containing protein [Calothrix sp. FI2-JRJ7]
MTTVYTVQAGDTLFKIAESFYGDGNLWGKSSAANGNIAPETLQVGQVLQIP